MLVADLGLLALFLGLTFLLGVFPLKDADIYWHLRTGDWIRQMGWVPRVDLYTFTRSSEPWIDLHWMFQVAISWLYEKGGIVALNLAKCVVTSVALFVLVTARRREWPIWVILLSWLPALLVLGGRIYVRPETLTLLYLSIFLAVLMRWDRHPYLASVVLPIVQVFWVNSQGLFILGPIILVFALVDAVLTRGSFAPERRRWWKIVGLGSLATFAACLINPYGISGALFPIQIAGTMGNPVFSRSILELTPIPEFIKRAGFRNLPLQLHLFTMGLGALSFLIPISWVILVRLFGASVARSPEPGTEVSISLTKTKREKKTRSKKNDRKKLTKTIEAKTSTSDTGLGWRLSPFRLLLFAAFSLLSLQATRNSHQFAAVVGSVTAWNFGEWAAAIQRRRAAHAALEPNKLSTLWETEVAPRLVAAVTIASVLAWVGSGWFYEMTGEKRTISLGEDPLFFPHEAAKFAGLAEMPERFLSFHNGHAALFEYYHGPDRKVYTDPRLEVAGPELFSRYQDLELAIRNDQGGWRGQLDQMGRPVILVDHEYNATVGATLFRDPHWRCIWFDAIAAVFVHETSTEAIRLHAVDFAARHFQPGRSVEPQGIRELTASSMGFRTYFQSVVGKDRDRARPMAWLGLDYARRLIEAAPGLADGWRIAGQIELFREPPPNSPRFRLPYDPIFDLSIIRAGYALRRGWELPGRDFTTLWMLSLTFEFRLMYEAALPLTEEMLSLHPINQQQANLQLEAAAKVARFRNELGPVPTSEWRNLAELDTIVTRMLATGRAESAADLLEKGYPPERIPWEILDRIATLRLHLGQTARARDLWRKAEKGPESAIGKARIGVTYLAEGNFESARRSYQDALQVNPDLFEASYSLAVLEQDAGDASAAYHFAERAIAAAPNDLSRTAARTIANSVKAFAREAGEGTQPQRSIDQR